MQLKARGISRPQYHTAPSINYCSMLMIINAGCNNSLPLLLACVQASGLEEKMERQRTSLGVYMLD